VTGSLEGCFRTIYLQEYGQKGRKDGKQLCRKQIAEVELGIQ